MNIFSDEVRLNATLAKWSHRMVKAKGASAKDGAKIPMIDFTFHVPLTAALRDLLPAKLSQLVKLEPPKGEQADPAELLVNSTDIKSSMTPAYFSIFKRGNFAEKGKALVTAGGKDNAKCGADVGRLFTKDGATMMEVKVACQKTETLWLWLGNNFQDSDVTIEVRQLQGELPFDAAATDEGVDPETGEIPQKNPKGK
jgi:hypothetical protein